MPKQNAVIETLMLRMKKRKKKLKNDIIVRRSSYIIAGRFSDIRCPSPTKKKNPMRYKYQQIEVYLSTICWDQLMSSFETIMLIRISS